MQLEGLEVVIGSVLEGDIGGHTVGEFLSPVDRHTASDLYEGEQEIIHTEYLLSLDEVGCVAFLR